MTAIVKYRLVLNGRQEHLLRDTWEEAAQDAVDHGAGRWDNKHEFSLNYPHEIKAVRVEPMKVEDGK